MTTRKTLGQVMYEAFHKGTNGDHAEAYSRMVYVQQEHWERAADAVAGAAQRASLVALPKAGDAAVPGERSTAEYSELAIAVARDDGRLRVDKDGLGWIHGMEPDRTQEREP